SGMWRRGAAFRRGPSVSRDTRAQALSISTLYKDGGAGSVSWANAVVQRRRRRAMTFTIGAMITQCATLCGASDLKVYAMSDLKKDSSMKSLALTFVMAAA